MSASQCLGRFVRYTKGVGLLSFDDGDTFHVPYRCEALARNTGLCEACEKKAKTTAEKVKELGGPMSGGLFPSYLHGRVTEPIPFWSRLYDGAWFRLKRASGCNVSEEDMAKAKKGAAVAYEGVEVVAPQPMPLAAIGKVVAKRGTAAAAAVVVTPIVAAPVVAAAPKKVSKPKAVTKAAEKPIVAAAPAPVAKVDPAELPIEETREVHVRPVEVDGRKLYLEPRKGKLYDLKFKYIGRLKDEKIVAFPDSDAELP